MPKTPFITFEGGEGTGKSTQAKLLVEAFQLAGKDAIYTREPGGTPNAETIRALLVNGATDAWVPMTETLLHMAARSEHVQRCIIPALLKGTYVICDRFIDSTVAYQGYGHGLGRQLVEQLHHLTIGEFWPDITFILDMDSSKGLTRAQERGTEENRYEQMQGDFHESVRRSFRETAAREQDRCILISANNSIDQIHAEILRHVNKKLGMALESGI